jgi:DNA-binding response OmpR family regulator
MNATTLKTALVVDDSPVVRNLLRMTVRPLGFAVVEAADGRDGLDLLREKRFDLVITDSDMPRMDGLEFIRRVRGDERLRDLPVVMLTAREDAEERFLALEAGADAFLTKDVSPSVVRRCIQALMRPGAPGPFHRGAAFGGLAQPASLARALFVGLSGSFAAGIGSRLLERGYAVVESSEPSDALEWLESAGPVEACLVSGNLPADGAFDFVRRLRENGRLDETKVLILLAEPVAGKVIAAARAGADDCMTESMGADEVIRRIEELARPGPTS